MAGCLSPCPTDIVIQATGAPWHELVTGTLPPPHVFSWSIPAGITIAHVRSVIEWKVTSGSATARYPASFPVFLYEFVASTTGSYSSSVSGGPLVYTGTLAPGNTITATLDYLSGDGHGFEVEITCWALIITPVCDKSLISIGSGRSATVCTSVEARVGISPQWVLDGDKSWVILDSHGVIVNSSLGASGFPRVTFFDSPCHYAIIETDCYPHVIDATHRLGDPALTAPGPYHAEFLIFVGNRGAGPEYDVATCSPFNIVIDQVCDDAGGGSGTIYGDGSTGLDLLYWREGYHIASAGGGGLGMTTKWHWDSQENAFGARVDTGACAYPKLSHARAGPPLGVVYARGTDTSRAIYRQESRDYGKTWSKDPPDGSAFHTGANGVSFAAEVWNDRTQERVNFYNDASDTATDGTPTGKGVIYCDVYGPHMDEGTGLLVKDPTGPFRVTPTGALADATSFGAIFVRQAGAIDVCAYVDGAEKVYRSIDDARSFSVV